MRAAGINCMSLTNNPLRTRSDVSAALHELCQPALARLSPGRARLRIGSSGAAHSRTVQEMEGFCRLLWGVAASVAGACGPTSLVDGVCEGLANGTDPRHPEFWGAANDYDQRFVEC